MKGMMAAKAASFMKKSKLIILCVSTVLVLSLLLCGCDYDFTPKPTSPIRNPKLVLLDFVECLRSRDFDGSMMYISNYADLGYADELSSEVDAVTVFLYECLLESYKVEFSDYENIVSISDSVSETDYRVIGNEATVDFVFTTVDLNAIVQRMSELCTEIGHEKMYNGYVYDSDEKAEQLILEVLEIVKNEAVEQYYVKYDLSINMKYTDNMWKMEMTDEFYEILLGGCTE